MSGLSVAWTEEAELCSKCTLNEQGQVEGFRWSVGSPRTETHNTSTEFSHRVVAMFVVVDLKV